MNRTSLLSSLLLFTAAFGWMRYPPPLNSTSRVTRTFLSVERARRLREQTIPVSCALLGVAVLVGGWERKEPNSSVSDVSQQEAG